MFNNTNIKTELIIVCDEKMMEYANYLMQLIGQADEKVLGTKAGVVSAAIYTDKIYRDSLPKITANTRVLFIGNSNLVKEQSKNINCQFNKYGMHYGWLGKRAVMYVDNDMLKKDDYRKFISFSKDYQKEFEKVTVNFVNTLPSAVKWIGVFLPVVYPAAIYGLISGSKAHKKVKDQQYRCLTIAWYMNGLQKFLEE